MHFVKFLLTGLAVCGLSLGRTSATTKKKAEGPRYLNPKSQKFAVDGKKLPQMNFDIGESYAGQLPVSSDANETRGDLLFWFFPSQDADVNDEIAIWINGRDCTSHKDILTQHGPFTWMDGTKTPTLNPYSWSNLTNVLYLEMPSVDRDENYNVDIKKGTDQVKGFWKLFVDIFEMQKYQVFLNGQADGGKFLTYLAESFADDKDKDYFNIKGVTLNNPTLGSIVLYDQYPMVPFFNEWYKLMGTDPKLMVEINDLYNKGPQPAYTSKYFTFPPSQSPFPEAPSYNKYYHLTYAGSREPNKCFNGENILMRCPRKENHWGYSTSLEYFNDGSENWFKRQDVLEAIHWKPPRPSWACYYDDYLTYPRPGLDGTFGRVIDKVKNVIIGAGILNYNVYANGTLFSLQNVTWGGRQGFSNYPNQPLYIPEHFNDNTLAKGAHGNLGVWTQERGLTFYFANWAGKQLYGDAPTVGYRMIQQMLGHITNLSSTAPLF